jgi:hypothetical protein
VKEREVMMYSVVSALALIAAAASAQDTVLTETSVIMTNAPFCLEQSDFEEIILDIEKGGSGEAVYQSKPGCNRLTDGVLLQLVRKVDSYEFNGVTFWLFEAKVFDSEQILYLGLPAQAFFDSKKIV